MGGGGIYSPLKDKNLLNPNQLDTLSKNVSSQIKTLSDLGNKATQAQKTQLAQLKIQEQAINVLQHLQNDPSLFKNSQIANLAKSLQVNAGITKSGVGIMSLGLVLAQSNELLQLINPSQFNSPTQPTLIASNYALENNANLKIVESLSSLRKQSFEGYLREYLGQINGYMTQSNNNHISGASNNAILIKIKTEVEKMLSSLKTPNSTLRDIKTDLSDIITTIQNNTIGANNLITDRDIISNGFMSNTDLSQSTPQTKNAYLAPSFGALNLMFFKMMQGIATSDPKTNYAYALGYAFGNLSNQYVGNYILNTFATCSSPNQDSCLQGDNDRPSPLYNIINEMAPNLISYLNNLALEVGYIFAKNIVGNMSHMQQTATELKEKISALDFTTNPTKQNEQQQALNIIDKFLKSIPLYEAQVSNRSMYFSA
ncbi:hypothetical protein [Helicobacter cetorum]|uniref:hypothetical protein n=1 Tax=Helicobacter cetorum TaxID=138563 RepID=UPI000CF0CB58|nr:hypothetical protein [Helicobacter cetorum]